MASNSFGQVLTITTWGESHGPAIGVVVDGCPAGIPLSVDTINTALLRRAPGNHAHLATQGISLNCSPAYMTANHRHPISILIRNRDANSRHYDSAKSVYRPGHANFTYLNKYGRFDHRGGGRASARACRVAAGTIAEHALGLKE